LRNLVVKMTKNIILFCSFLFIISGCKKTTEYRLSPQIRNYFTFKPGSYWIYRNDSTGELDSTYVTNYTNHILENEQQTVNWEVLLVDFNSLFLKRIEVFINSCQQNNYAALIGGDLSGSNLAGGVIYFSEWPQKKFLVPECEPGILYYFEMKSTDTINSHIYHDVLFTELQYIDSSGHINLRRTSFSPDFGFLKYYVKNNKEDIIRSFTLIRSKIIK